MIDIQYTTMLIEKKEFIFAFATLAIIGAAILYEKVKLYL
jgi:hypothetical protein